MPYVFLVFLVATCGVAAQLPTPSGKWETEQYSRMAKAWTELADVAVSKGSKSAATAALVEAETCGFAGPARDRLAERIEATEGDVESPDVKRKGVEVRGRVCQCLDELTKRAEDPARSEAYFFESLRVAPDDKKRLAGLQSKVNAAAAAQDEAKTARLLKRAALVDVDGFKAGKYSASEGWLGREGLLLVAAPKHRLQAYVSLPKDWRPGAKKPWPVIVAYEGAGCGFEGRAREMKKAVGKGPYVVVVPVTYSNANDLEAKDYPDYDPEVTRKFTSLATRAERAAWDMEGALSLLPHLRERFQIAEKIFVTGYSGGAFPTYDWLMNRPFEVAAACPVSANYGSMFENGGVKPENGGPPVYLITGENDSAKERIFPQTDEAIAALKARGFADVAHRRLKGRGHEPFHDLAIEFFDEVRKRPAR